MSAALFGSSARSSSKNLVEFRAGKMIMKGKMVHPDKRKGLVYVYQSDDTLMHFCWKDRNSGSLEEDLIIFPDDCEYKKVNQCTTGRVFVLRFKSNNRRIFFWMQEPKTDKDEEYCRKVNDYLNNPPAPGGSQRSSSSTPNPVLGGSDLSSLQNSDIHNFIGKISQQQLMQILGNGVPSLATLLGPNTGGRSSSSGSAGSSSSSGGNATSGNGGSTSTSSSSPASPTTNVTTTTTSSTSSTTATSSSSGHSIQLSDLQNILSGIGIPPEGQDRVPVDLGSMMNAEALQPILTNEKFVEELRPYLPTTTEKLPPVEELKGTVTSPQFQQAVNLFTSALQSGQLGPLINQFGLGEDAVTAATSCDMEAFIKALEDKGSKKEEDREKGKDQDKDEDDSMSLD